MIGVELGVLMLPSPTPPAQIRERARRFGQHQTPPLRCQGELRSLDTHEANDPQLLLLACAISTLGAFSHSLQSPFAARPSAEKDFGFSKEPSRVI
jgi:hypothetical protein